MKQNYFLKCMWKYCGYFAVELALSYLLAEVVVRGNDLIGTAIDTMLSGKEVLFSSFLGVLVSMILLGFAAAFVKSVMASKFSIKVQTRYKTMVGRKLYGLEYRYFDENGSGEVINKVNSDVAEADILLNENLPQLCANGVAILTYAVYVAKLNWQLVVVMLLCYPILFFASNLIVKKVVSLKKVHREKSDMINSIAQDCMSGILVLRCFQAEAYFEKKLDRAADDLVDNEEKRTRISNTVLIIRKLLQWLPNIICAFYAYALVLGGNMSIGGLVAFIMILGRFVEAFMGIPFDLVDVKEHIVCIKRVENILNARDEAGGTETSGPGDTIIAVSFEKVSFSYAEDAPVLQELSFQIPTGSSVAFVGESGGGKSTIFHILCGFYPVSGGTYQLFGRDFDQWDREAAREQMALVSQNVFLFPGTIYENVAYGKQDASGEQIINACKSARIHDFIVSLPEGYDTLVGERGILLSGGERQRISIARAILKDAPILLLDEPTSAVDVETEHLIQEAIESLSQNRTCITIAHRLSTIRNADRILVLEHGKITEAGTHRELMEAGGAYAAMYGKEETA